MWCLFPTLEVMQVFEKGFQVPHWRSLIRKGRNIFWDIDPTTWKCELYRHMLLAIHVLEEEFLMYVFVRGRDSMCSIIRTKNCTKLPLAMGTSSKHIALFPCV